MNNIFILLFLIMFSIFSCSGKENNKFLNNENQNRYFTYDPLIKYIEIEYNENEEIKIIIGYDLRDNDTTIELLNRQIELKYFLNLYINNIFKNNINIGDENNYKLNNEIKYLLNEHFFEKAKVLVVLLINE